MVPYQEFYPGRADPLQLAQIVAKGTVGQRFHRFIIDRRAGRQQTMGLAHGTRVVDAYAEAFKKMGVTCKLSGSQFAFGSDDVGGRQLVLLSWLHPGKSPYPKLRIVTHRCPNLCDQMRKVKKRTIQREVHDERKIRGAWDCCDCLEYLAASHPRFIPRKISIEDGSPAYQRYMKKFGNKQSRPVVKFGI